jgi:hypothetical protein
MAYLMPMGDRSSDLDGELDGNTPVPDAITSLRFYGSPHAPLPLPARARLFTIGTAPCDITVPHELAHDVAPVHATIERVEGAIRICDQLSRHGLYRRPRSARVPELLLYPGAVGWVGGCGIVALTPALEALRATLARCVGLDAHLAIDEAIAIVADGGPIALLGPRNLDVMMLARAIHAAGPDGGAAFAGCVDDAEVPMIEGATGTRVIELDRVRRFPAGQVAAMFAARCEARVILLAHDERVVRRHLDAHAERVRWIALAPLGQRRHEVVRLLQGIWRDELGTARRVDALGARALDGLAAHAWRGNLDELRAMAARLLAYVEHPTLRAAAEALGIRRQTLAQHLDRVGVPTLDRGDREQDGWRPRVSRG